MSFFINNNLNNFKEKNTWWGVLIMTIILALCTWIAVTRDWFPVFDYVNLIFHEAGHWIWAIFGETMKFLGGSLNQVLIPIICLIVLVIKRKWLGAMFSLWWTGQSLVNLSVYIGDAWAKALPLLGGDNVVHDWNWLLGMWGLRDYDTQIASTVWWIGTALMVGAVIWGLILFFILLRFKKQKVVDSKGNS
ncbi:MAG: hypothetical protein Q8P20_06645 [bacterium]|nr:hypothetical protein [bacterium]